MRKSFVSAVVSLGGVFRDVIVVRENDQYRVVDARTLLPLKGYSPMLPHYTQHSVYQMVKTARWTGYNGRKVERLLAETTTVSPFFVARDIFAHINEVFSNHDADERKAIVKGLATSSAQ